MRGCYDFKTNQTKGDNKMKQFNFKPPKIKRKDIILTDSKGLFKTYLQQVNDVRIDTDKLDVPDINVVTQAVKFELKSRPVSFLKFNIIW